ncbi:MAG: WD40/YVTN/BNR-like repeat-containing protein, partial [Gemmataceae bacterium]
MSQNRLHAGVCVYLLLLGTAPGTEARAQQNKTQSDPVSQSQRAGNKSKAPKQLDFLANSDAHEQRFFDDATLHAVQFLPNAKQGWAVGDEGVVWHTVDGGKVWARQPTGTRASLRSVCFLNANVGWIVGREELPTKGMSTGVILYTRDGGANWTRFLENEMPGMNRIRFIDGKTGFLMGDATSRFPSGLYKTTTGGRDWRKVGGTRATSWLDGDFDKADVGALVGEWSQMAKLRQSGVIGVKPERLEGRSIRAIRMFDNKHTVAVGDGGFVLLSQTKGSGWALAKTKLSDQVKKNIDFRAVDALANQIWVVGRPGSVVFHSRDSGETWTFHKTDHPLPLNGIYFIDGRRGWAVGELGSILVTKDGGRTWKVQRQGGRRTSLLFAHADARSVPLETIVRLGREDGFLIAGIRVVASDSKSAPQENVQDRNRFAAAVRRAGGATGEMLWQFPLPEYFSGAKASDIMNYWNRMHDYEAPNQMLRQLVLALRMWRPNVVVTDGPSETGGNGVPQQAARSIVHENMRRAYILAADPKQFPEQIQVLGLQPWKASKIYSVWPTKKGSHVVIDAMQIGRRLMGTPQDTASVALPLIAKKDDEIPSSRFFQLVGSHIEGAKDFRTLMAGVEGEADKG